VIARPIFVDPAHSLPASAATGRTKSDIGGGLAGTYNPEATEICTKHSIARSELVDRERFAMTSETASHQLAHG